MNDLSAANHVQACIRWLKLGETINTHIADCYKIQQQYLYKTRIKKLRSFKSVVLSIKSFDSQRVKPVLVFQGKMSARRDFCLTVYAKSMHHQSQ